MNYHETVTEFVIENFLFGEGDRLKDDVSLIESGIVDSTGILELIVFLEETYAVVIEDEEVVPENLDSVTSIMKFLEKKMNGNRPLRS
jgi:acyl carrier protein